MDGSVTGVSGGTLARERAVSGVRNAHGAIVALIRRARIQPRGTVGSRVRQITHTPIAADLVDTTAVDARVWRATIHVLLAVVSCSEKTPASEQDQEHETLLHYYTSWRCGVVVSGVRQ